MTDAKEIWLWIAITWSFFGICTIIFAFVALDMKDRIKALEGKLNKKEVR